MQGGVSPSTLPIEAGPLGSQKHKIHGTSRSASKQEYASEAQGDVHYPGRGVLHSGPCYQGYSYLL